MSEPFTREPVFAALFALAERVTWEFGGEPQKFEFMARRFKLFDDLPAQPALCQAEPREHFTQVTRMPSKRVFDVSWIICHQAGKDPDGTPTTANNAILDAVEAALGPDDMDDRCTLGGLVHHCWIEGEVFKDAGDLDNQALLMIPIKIMVP